MLSPPDLARARELVQLIEQELFRLQANPDSCDPAVPSLADYVDELAVVIGKSPSASSAVASNEAEREMKWLSQRVIAEAAWWLLRQFLEKARGD